MNRLRDFGWAILMLKDGKRVCREGWNGKGMYLILNNGQKRPTVIQVSKMPDGDDMLSVNPHIWMRNAKGQWQPGWVASQEDMLAEDWEVA